MSFEDDNDSEDFESIPKNNGFSHALQVILIAIAVALVWSVWTIRADMNILLAYQKEHVQQYTHISKLLQNMKQVQWQIVPAINP